MIDKKVLKLQRLGLITRIFRGFHFYLFIASQKVYMHWGQEQKDPRKSRKIKYLQIQRNNLINK